MTDHDVGTLVPKKHFECAHCGEPTFDGYMVHDHVWSWVMPTKSGLLHLHCLEAKLGRMLTLRDFTNAAINIPIRHGYHIAERRNEAAYARCRMLLEQCSKNDDTESAHVDADVALREFVSELGFADVAADYDKVNKWYA